MVNLLGWSVLFATFWRPSFTFRVARHEGNKTRGCNSVKWCFNLRTESECLSHVEYPHRGNSNQMNLCTWSYYCDRGWCPLKAWERPRSDSGTAEWGCNSKSELQGLRHLSAKDAACIVPTPAPLPTPPPPTPAPLPDCGVTPKCNTVHRCHELKAKDACLSHVETFLARFTTPASRTCIWSYHCDMGDRCPLSHLEEQMHRNNQGNFHIRGNPARWGCQAQTDIDNRRHQQAQKAECAPECSVPTPAPPTPAPSCVSTPQCNVVNRCNSLRTEGACLSHRENIHSHWLENMCTWSYHCRPGDHCPLNLLEEKAQRNNQGNFRGSAEWGCRSYFELSNCRHHQADTAECAKPNETTCS